MRRYLFAVLTSLVVIAAVPASSLAQSHHARHHHRSHARNHSARHVRKQHQLRHFGAAQGPANPTSNPTSMDAGTVLSFQNNVLTIKLNDLSTVSGTVDASTEIQCESMNQDFTRHDGGSGSGSGDNNGGGQRGDDNGGSHNGDDNGGSDDNGGDDGGANCMTARQTVGTPVRDASLSVSSAGAVWESVDLDVPSSGGSDS